MPIGYLQQPMTAESLAGDNGDNGEPATFSQPKSKKVRFTSPCLEAVFLVVHQDNMSVQFIPPYTPLFYSKTGVYRGIHFLVFALKHRLWVLVRTASLRRL